MKKMHSVIAAFALGAGVALLSERARPTETGTYMPDGSVYAGISPDTRRPIYTTAEDAPGLYTFDQAKTYCSSLDINGQDTWRVPTLGELNVLFNNRVAIGGFNESGSSNGWYWSSTEYNPVVGRVQKFSNGDQNYSVKDLDKSLRCVR